MKWNHILTVTSVLFFLSVSIVSSVSAQEEESNSADINVRIIGDILPVAISIWTDIEIEFIDAFGIDWKQLSDPDKGIPIWWMKIVWPYNPAFPQPVERFFGPTSFKLEPKIIRGNPQGWHMKMSPSTINESLTGDKHQTNLSVQADDAYLDNSVTIGIKVTRNCVFGEEIGHSYIYVPVKISPMNLVKMNTNGPTTQEAALKSFVSFNLDVINEGFYKDVFEFEIEKDNGLLALTNQQTVTIHPGETKRVTLEILTPEKLYDLGTPNEIKIYVRSSGNETKTLVGTLIVITKGLYFSPLTMIIVTFLIASLVVGYVVFLFFKDKRDKELYGKPDKTWNLPDEQKHLQELKEKDTKQYQQVLNMMKLEQQSALLSWKNRQHKKKKTFLSKDWFSSFKNELKKTVEKPEKNKTETNGKNIKNPSEKPTKNRRNPSPEGKKEKSTSSKLVTGIKKWFTIPDEEKQKKLVNSRRKLKEPVEKEYQLKDGFVDKNQQIPF